MSARIFKAKNIGLGLIGALLAAPLIFSLYVHAAATSIASAEPAYDLQPVINSDSVPPLVMLVMSRDEQLYNKAYTDFTDLHQGETGDTGVIDSTYDDTFSYAGYFGPKLCYSYGGGVFKADAAAAGANLHSCSGEWSGNFLNWVAMSRLDVVRQVLYGGLRSTDTVGQPINTVLERAAIPNDLHAWVKVYSGADVASYTPFGYDPANPVSFCNATIYNSSGVPTTGLSAGPLMRVARGNWSEWSSTQDSQCNWHDTDGDSNNAPQAAGLGSSEYTVRVDVCDETGVVPLEPFCQPYTDTSVSPNTTDNKPVGLLQQYGQSGKIRFGLMTGSYAEPRTGGRLRRNIGKFAGNGTDPTVCAAGDEVKLSNGTFCAALGDLSGTEGIVNTMNRLQLVGWQSQINGSGSGWKGDSAGDNCYAWGGRARNGNGGTWYMDNPGGAGGTRHCSAYGNPLSEIYAEAVRYIEGDGAVPSAAFTAADVNGNQDPKYVAGIPDQVTWKDPYRDPTSHADPGNPYCASCSILVLSTGLNSFDSDEIPNDMTGIVSPANVITDTDTLGDDEGISGHDYLIGRVLGKLTDNGTISPTSLTIGANIDTNADLCTRKNVDRLSNAIGICPDVPSLEGSYGIAGLAFKAWTTDLRPDLKGATGQNKPADFINKVQTYTVALAESLPTFTINAGGSPVNFSPLCQSNTNGGAQIAGANWSSCALGSVEVGTKTSIFGPQYIYGRPLLSDNTAGSFAFLWEDSTFGSDHDLDATDMITWCVGAACSYTNGQAKKNLDGTPFTGADICWRSDHTSANLDYSAVCGANDQPAIGPNDVLVRIETMSTAGGYAMLTGYNITGTTTDAVERLELAPGSFNSILTGQTNPPAGWYHPVVLKFAAGGAGVQPLKNPLYYAAKYGGFQDQDNDNTPKNIDGSSKEWDAINNTTGAPGADGLPDNFFPVHNPSLLAQQLGNALNAIIKKTGSGTAAAVVSNTVNGDGVVYRAVYQPETQDAAQNKVFWTGTLDTLFTDSFGLLREDGDQNAQLTNYNVDPIVVFFSDPATNAPEFSECQTSNSGFRPGNFSPIDPVTGMFSQTQLNTTCPGNMGLAAQPLDKVKTIWDAQQQLWANSGPFATNIAAQRTPYTDSAANGRYIFTWVDKNHNGIVDTGEQTAFVWSTSGPVGFYGLKNGDGTLSGDLGFLNSNDPVEAQNIVDWIRGEDDAAFLASSGMRSRTIDGTAFGAAAGNISTRLGDIIDSTPLVIGRPAEAYDLLYGDTTYAKFRAHYRDRRQVAYVGANDGMLHAFNGGFYDASQHKLSKTPISGVATAHPLGSEIWAYVPGNLLPHLRWLTDKAYQAQHVFYVDGNPVATDAKVFAPDAGNCRGVVAPAQCHPGGWGTVLVVPFRLGGGMIQTPTALDDTSHYDPTACSPATCIKQTSYSAYVVLDVTDPEQPPTVLAELTPASTDGNGQSFTTSVPAFAVIRDPTSGNPDNFFLFLGSGPTAPAFTGLKGTAVTSAAPLRLFAYDLGCVSGTTPRPTDCGADTITPLTVAGGKTEFDFSNVGAAGKGANSFAGDLIASDFDLNDKAEAVYFGSVRDEGGGPPIEFKGSLWKLALRENPDATTWTPEMVYDVGLPVLARPTIALNDRGAPEVYIGTGRLLAKDDLTTVDQQLIAGMIDPELLPVGDPQAPFTLPLKMTDLENVTNVQVCADNSKAPLCTFGAVTGDPSGRTTYKQLQQLFDEPPAIGGKAGFYRNLSAPGTSPAERVVSAQALLGGVLVTNAFTPGTSICNNVGTAEEFALNYRSGSGDPNLASASNGFGFGKNPATGMAITSVSLGAGLPASPSLHVGMGTGKHGVTACTQTSTGAIICQKIDVLGPVLSGELSWREPLDQ